MQLSERLRIVTSRSPSSYSFEFTGRPRISPGQACHRAGSAAHLGTLLGPALMQAALLGLFRLAHVWKSKASEDWSGTFACGSFMAFTRMAA